MSCFIIYLALDARQHWAGENVHLPHQSAQVGAEIRNEVFSQMISFSNAHFYLPSGQQFPVKLKSFQLKMETNVFFCGISVERKLWFSSLSDFYDDRYVCLPVLLTVNQHYCRKIRPITGPWRQSRLPGPFSHKSTTLYKKNR